MRIVIYGINYSPELTGIGKYNGEMVDWLIKQGHECTVVTSFPYYPYWKTQKPYNSNFYKKELFVDRNLTVYRCPLYIPQKPSGLKRIFHDASYFLSSFQIFVRLLFKKKFDHLIVVAPPFHIGLTALVFRFFKGSKVTYHIQDLQIDAAKELNLIRSKTLVKAMFSIEKFIIRKADNVSSISDGMIKKIALKSDRSIIKFPNWTDVNNFKPLAGRKALKTNWGFAEDDYIVLYSGSLGEKQGLNVIVQVAAATAKTKNIKYVICGTGSYKEKLLELVNKQRLVNIIFLPLQEYKVFNEFLNMADIHLVLQKLDASDLVLPSKLVTILAVGGLALVTAVPGTTLYDTISENNIGLLAVPEDMNSITEVIYSSYQNNYEDICQKARQYAEDNLSIDHVMSQFVKEIDQNV